MQQSIVKFIALSYRHCSTCFGHLLTNRPRLRTLPPPHSYGNQRLQRQFDGLLMMGIVMPETCWPVSVRQSNNFYDWLLNLVGCFIWEFGYTQQSSGVLCFLCVNGFVLPARHHTPTDNDIQMKTKLFPTLIIWWYLQFYIFTILYWL